MTTPMMPKELEFASGRDFNLSKDAFTSMVSTNANTVIGSQFVFEGNVPFGALVAGCIDEVPAGTDDSVLMNCCRNLQVVQLPMQDTEIDYGTILVDKAMKVSLYSKCEKWAVANNLICGMIHNACTSDTKRELLTNPAYVNAKRLNEARSMWLTLVATLSLNGGTTGDPNSQTLQLARFVRDMVGTKQDKNEACSSYLDRFDTCVNNVAALEVDITAGMGPQLIIGSIITGLDEKYHPDMYLATKGGEIRALTTYAGCKTLITKWDLINKNIESSMPNNNVKGDVRRVNAVNVKEIRDSQHAGKDLVIGSRNFNGNKKVYCFVCDTKMDHWADECTANAIFDDAAAARYTAFRKATFVMANKNPNFNNKKNANKTNENENKE